MAGLTNPGSIFISSDSHQLKAAKKTGLAVVSTTEDRVEGPNSKWLFWKGSRRNTP
jgi:methionine salvage enolase-phosphatase E1